MSESVSLSQAFQYPLTPLPLSIATPEGRIRQAPKHIFRNFLIDESMLLTNILPLNARWLINVMAALRSVRPKGTWKQGLSRLLSFIQPPKESNPLSVELVNDRYIANSIKKTTREKREKQQQRTYIQRFQQKMPQGNAWLVLVNCIERETDVIKLAPSYLKDIGTGHSYSMPVIFTDSKEPWEASSDSVKILFLCNHEETDARLVLHVCLEDKHVVVIAKETDVLILLIYAYKVVKPKCSWHMKINYEKSIDIAKVHAFLSSRILRYLPQIHAIMGCDTTSLFYGIGKVKVLKKLKKDSSPLTLLQEIGRSECLSQGRVIDASRCLQTVLHKGRFQEYLVEALIRLYKALKTKSSKALPPDPDSLTQAISRVHLQSYFWLQFQQKNIKERNIEQNGWCIDDPSVVPVWFTGKVCHRKSIAKSPFRIGPVGSIKVFTLQTGTLLYCSNLKSRVR